MSGAIEVFDRLERDVEDLDEQNVEENMVFEEDMLFDGNRLSAHPFSDLMFPN